ncbi:MAG: hypothetical protein DMG94_07990 [Acidobacteria bacterium]|nr:MAG: hypothetical protein DMG94_07990 [Acidobacteriota bacterium]
MPQSKTCPPSEDCLNLNVWTPAKRAHEKLPVLFWPTAVASLRVQRP